MLLKGVPLADLPRAVKGESFLFPNAMVFPGWHHMWDNCLKFCLMTIPWVPDFLKLLKAVISFFRLDAKWAGHGA
eukprot:3872128-Pyramimonas_sp.AAC.3